MATRAKARQAKAKQTESGPDFLSAPELAKRIGVRAETVDRWVAGGKFPPPWVYLGPCRRAWRADHYEAFRTTGAWPKEAWGRR